MDAFELYKELKTVCVRVLSLCVTIDEIKEREVVSVEMSSATVGDANKIDGIMQRYGFTLQKIAPRCCGNGIKLVYVRGDEREGGSNRKS